MASGSEAVFITPKAVTRVRKTQAAACTSANREEYSLSLKRTLHCLRFSSNTPETALMTASWHAFVLSTWLCHCSVAAATPEYLFRDDFNEAELDRSTWNVEVNCNGGGNGELQCYVDSAENVYLRDGMLHITARKESDGRITSGRLTTQGKVEAAYGRWEARLKVPGVLGTWPAFWTLGNDIGEVSWPTCGEIDIMENFQRPSPDRSGEGIYSTAHSAKHSWGTGTALPGGTSKALDLNLFHTVRMDWSPDKLEFFVNGERTWHLDRNPGSTNLDWPFAKPHFALLNLAIGGNGVAGARPPDNAYPLTYSIDYFSIEALPPPPSPPLPLSSPSQGSRCGTASCTAPVWEAMAGSHSCGDRITWLQESPAGPRMNEADACARIAATEYPAACSGCDPTATSRDSPPPSPSPPPPPSPSPPPPTQGTCAPEGWVGYDRVTCGECSALVNVRDNGGTCEGFCSLQGLACIEGRDDENEEECSPEAAVRSCSYNFPGTSDAICECTRGGRRLFQLQSRLFNLQKSSPSHSSPASLRDMLPMATAAAVLSGVATFLVMRYCIASQSMKLEAAKGSERAISV